MNILPIIIVGLGLFMIAVVGYKLVRRVTGESGASDDSSLRSEKLQTETLLRALADGVFVMDTNGKIKLVNPAGADLVGWAQDEVINLDIGTVVHLAQEDGKPLPDANNPFKEVIKNKQAVKNTYQLTAR